MADIVCTNCGATIDEGKKFCPACGSAVGAAAPAPPVTPAPAPVAAPVATAAPPQQVASPFPPPPPKGSPYAVIGTLGYVGTFLVLSIPIVGLILMIVWATGGAKNQNRRNLARAMLVFLIISLVISIIGTVIWMPVIQELAKTAGSVSAMEGLLFL